MEDIYIQAYLGKIEELFISYKDNPTDENYLSIAKVVDHFINTGYKLPFDCEVYFSGGQQLIDELFISKGIVVSK